MKSTELLEQLFDRKMLAVIRLFVANPEKEYGVREVSKHTRVPLATAFRILSRLVSLEILSFTRIKTLKLYRLNSNDATAYISNMLATKKSALDEFVKKASLINGVQEIILHGKEEKNKANLLMIGTNIDPEALRLLVVEIRDAYDFNIIHLSLEPQQFEQMANMGLYPGKKITLFKR